MSLMRRAHEIYPRIGGTWNGQSKTWRFPGGETIRFGHIQHEKDVYQYQGAEFQFIAFDELTQFTEFQYTYLISRLRSSRGVPVRIRATTNPGGAGAEWVFRRFGRWLDPKHPEPAKPGEVVRIVRDVDGSEMVVPAGTPGALGRVFLPAQLKDNPHLAGTSYERNLDELDPVTRAQLRDGNWLIRPARGLYFKRAWVAVVDAAPITIRARIRYWDRAASVDGDYTVGVLASVTNDKKVTVEHVIRFRGRPGEVEERILATAKADGAGVVVGLEKDPGQAGEFEIDSYVKKLSGYRLHTPKPTGDKLTRFGPFSSQCEHGNVSFVRGPWLEPLFQELEAFPEDNHDDQADACSGAYAYLHSAPIYVQSSRHTFGERRDMSGF